MPIRHFDFSLDWTLTRVWPKQTRSPLFSYFIMASNRGKPGRHGLFLDKWLQEFQWLERRGTGVDLAMFCKDCSKAGKKTHSRQAVKTFKDQHLFVIWRRRIIKVQLRYWINSIVSKRRLTMRINWTRNPLPSKCEQHIGFQRKRCLLQNSFHFVNFR